MKQIAVIFSLLCICSIVFFSSCDSDEPVVVPDPAIVNFQETEVSIEEGLNTTITIKSDKALTSQDTIYVSFSTSQATLDVDYTLSLPLTSGVIRLVGANSTDLSFSVSSLYDYSFEAAENVTFQFDHVSSGLKAGTLSGTAVEITNKNSLKEDLIVEYLFDGNAEDTGPNGLDGTVNGATLTYDRYGDMSKAYHFDGESNIEVANNDLLNFDNNFTLAVWVKADLFKAMGSRIIDKSVGSSGGGFFLDTYTTANTKGNRIRFFCAYNGFANIMQQEIAKDTWYFIVSTYQDGFARVYINGELVLTNTAAEGKTTFTTDTTPLRFGFDTGVRTGPDFDDSLVGSIDDVRIFHRVIKPKEIADLYSNQLVPR